jgi:type I restriction enzyme S subunit
LGKGLTITKENLTDEGVLVVNYGEIHSKYGFEVNPKIHPLKYVSEDYLETNPEALLDNCNFIFADTSEDLEGSGNFTYLNSDEKVFAGYHTVIARPKSKINSRFFAYEFDSLNFRNQVRIKMKGVKVFSITQSILKDLSLWVPTQKEQEKIVEALDERCSKIDKTITLKKQEIEKLKEYKTVLIDNVVTGKIKIV